MHSALFGGCRYQVFLSSTFDDLTDERQKIIETLLKLNCFPIAMEHFPASYEKQWNYIQPLIAESDFFICLIGARYGTCDENGLSYTHREFLHAVEKDVPVIVFYHKDPSSIAYAQSESSDEGRRKLAAFTALAIEDRLSDEWTSAVELPGLVMPAIIDAAFRCNRPGWRRGGIKSKEFLELELRNSHLQNKILEIERQSQNAPLASYLDYVEAEPTIYQVLSDTATACKRMNDKLKVRLMGICLHTSFPTIKRFIENTNYDIRIELRLAILDEKSDIYTSLIPRWQTLYDMFHEDLNHLLEQIRSGALKRDISIKLTRYMHMPNWHGVMINHEDLFVGHCMLWYEKGTFSINHNPYDHYKKGCSRIHDRKIKQYVDWFDFCRQKDLTPKTNQVLIDAVVA